VNSGKLLLQEIIKSGAKLKAFISTSAIGYYGAVTTDHIFSEPDTAANDFLGSVCRKWEEIAESVNKQGIRTVIIRAGVVLAEKGSFLQKLRLPFEMGLGTVIGTGNQFIPWIHIDDLCGIYSKAIEDNRMSGAYNAVAPDHATLRDFTRELCLALESKMWLPAIPSFAVKSVLGQMSEILLEGSRVSSEKIRNAGYSFKFPQLKIAMENLLVKSY
jgi:hypothetical protein